MVKTYTVTVNLFSSTGKRPTETGKMLGITKSITQKVSNQMQTFAADPARSAKLLDAAAKVVKGKVAKRFATRRYISAYHPVGNLLNTMTKKIEWDKTGFDFLFTFPANDKGFMYAKIIEDGRAGRERPKTEKPYLFKGSVSGQVQSGRLSKFLSGGRYPKFMGLGVFSRKRRATPATHTISNAAKESKPEIARLVGRYLVKEINKTIKRGA